MQYDWISDTNIVLMLVYFHASKQQNAFYSNYLLFSSGKVSILKKFETENVFQETTEVFEDETATSAKIIEAGLNLLMKRYPNLTKFGEFFYLVYILRNETRLVCRSVHRY